MDYVIPAPFSVWMVDKVRARRDDLLLETYSKGNSLLLPRFSTFNRVPANIEMLITEVIASTRLLALWRKGFQKRIKGHYSV